MSSESPTTSSEATTEIRPLQARRGKKSIGPLGVLDIFVAIGAISQVGIGIVLIYQLLAYQTSNELTRQSLEITQKTYKASRIPWFSLENVSIGPVDKSIEVDGSLINHSDTPAFITGIECSIGPANLVPDITNKSDRTDYLMAGESKPIRFLLDSPNPADVCKSISSQQIPINFIFAYEEPGGGKFKMSVELKMVKDKLVGISTSVDGVREFLK